MAVDPTMVSMFRTYPARSCAISVVPVLLACAQIFNAVWHGISSPWVAVFALALLVFAWFATQISLANFRTEQLEANANR